MLLFKSHQLRRFGFVIMAGIVDLPIMLNLFGMGHFMMDAHLAVILVSLYLHLSIHLARWKNIGHTAVTFFIVAFGSMILDVVLKGAPGLILFIYLAFVKENSFQQDASSSEQYDS
ncbi:hypothetical protein [Photobacterium galatheae]|nr:hypothetical protein [Photobacterium galatheae]MCM0150031.1 hypothetical protein [Photobacterium galatheae]